MSMRNFPSDRQLQQIMATLSVPSKRRRVGGYLMEKIWLKNYPAGVPAEVDVDAYRSIGEVLEKSVARFGALPAYVNMGATISYSEVGRLSRDFAAYLQVTLKL